ncbi:MAG: sulfotransferase domain-containing protein [Nocardioidaceae bacterium]
MSRPPVRYTSADEDSARWMSYRFREGDVVISTRSKSGTTWVQMICLLLAHGTPELPGSLADLSPWVDHLVEPLDDVVARLERQRTRRVIKTHTPLDGVPLDDRATYVVVARHPLDMAASLWHQGNNIDRARVRALTGAPEPAGPETPRTPLETWLPRWVASTADPREEMDSLPGVMHHLTDAWQRRHADNVVLLHFEDLQADLEGQMRLLADRLAFDVRREAWPALVEAATFTRMRERSDVLAPNTLGILKDGKAFFRGGRSGDGRAVLSAEQVAAYERRTAELAPADLVAWLHR